jgi:RNA polymerase sigma-B factor
MSVQHRRRPTDEEAAEIAQLFKTYRVTRDRGLRNELVERHQWLASMAAKRFHHRGEPVEDLAQVALLGVLKAVERFDCERGTSFGSFAMPTVLGELRRHFRDKTWAVHVTRRAKELYLEAGTTRQALTHTLGRPPELDELAGALGVAVETMVSVLDAGNAYRTSPMDTKSSEDGSSLQSVALRAEDDRLAGVIDRLTLQRHLKALPERQRRLLQLRFFDEKTQAEIAAEVGLSQVHVSRLLRDAIRELRCAYGAAPVS